MSRLKSVSLLSSLVVLFCVTSYASAQDASALLGAMPAPKAQPLLTAKAIQDDAAHSVAIHTSEIPKDNLRDLGRAPAELRMDMVLELQRPPAEEKALADFVRQTESPDSALYGKTLSPAEFAEQFGLAASDLDGLRNWLTVKGFEVTTIDNGRLTIQFKGDGAQVEDAFHTEIHLYQGADGTQHFANATPLRVPRQLSRVIDTIEGTQNFTPMERSNFDGPVTDFALGTELENKVSPDASATPLPVHLTGEALQDASFTASRVTMNLKDGLTTLNVRLNGDSHPVTGSLSISSEEHGMIAVIRDVTVCEGYNSGYGRSCTLDFKPASGGVYTLHALYSGDDQTRASEQKLTVHANVGTNVTYQVETVSPITYYNYTGVTVQSGTLSWVISWSAPHTQAQPTGSVVFSLKSGNAVGTITLPAAGQTTSSGSCTAFAGTCSYACSYTAAQEIVSCTLTDTAMSTIVSSSSAGFKYTATYSGDTNYAIGTAAATEGYIAVDNATLTATLTASPTINASTYGTATTEPTFNATFTPTSGTVANYEGSSSGPFFELTGGAQLGSLVNNDTISAACTTACSIPSWTVPAVVTPGTYPLTLAFSGTGASTSGSFTSWYKEVISSSTLNLVVNPATPTLAMATPTASSPTNQVYGSTTAFNVTATLTWPGSGAPPNPVDVIFSSTAAGTFGATSCGTTSPATCTATFTPAGTSAVGSYNFSVYFAGATSTGVTGYDVNYMTTTASTIMSDYVINQATTSLALSAGTASSATSGVASTTLIATMTPAVAGVTVAFTNATTGQTASATTNSSGVATTTAQTSTLTGPNSWSAKVNGTANYTTQTSSSITVYQAGILVSSDTAEHTFSVDPGMYDNPTVGGCTASTNGSTCSTPYDILVSNFTGSTQVITVALNNSGSPNKAFSSATNCPAGGLASGKTCNVQFTYDPPYGDGCTLGSIGCTDGTFESATWSITSGTLPVGVGTLTSGAANSSSAVPATSTLGGKALLAAGTTLTVSPTGTLTFGPQAPGSVSGTQEITVTNSGSASIAIITSLSGTSAAKFTAGTGCNTTLAAGGKCQVSVSYSDANVASDTANLVITPATGSAITVVLNGTTQNNTGLSLNTNSHGFGPVVENTTASFGLSIVNNASVTATNSFGTSGSTEFTISVPSACNSLAAGASCQITVIFAPGSSTAAVTNALTITSNVSILPGGTGSGPYSDVVNFSGSGTAATTLTATTAGHNFGTVAIGSAATTYGLTLTNGTGVVLTLTLGGGSFASSGAADGFSEITNCGATLAVNASCQLQFGFTGTVVGTSQVVFPVTAVNGPTNYPLYSGGAVVTSGGVTLTGTGQ